VETCTVTALDAITAFAVPNPNCPSQSRRFFQVWLPFGSPRRADHSAYFELAKFYLSQSFQPSTGPTLETCLKIVNAPFWCNLHLALQQKQETQLIESQLLNEWEIKFFPLFHSYIHRYAKGRATPLAPNPRARPPQTLLQLREARQFRPPPKHRALAARRRS